MDIKNIRSEYSKGSIDFSNIPSDPINLFNLWIKDALELYKSDANACVLSTVDLENKPSSRVVLLREISNKGFIFYTNYNSNKSNDINNNNNVCLNFYWNQLERQVRVNGIVKKVDVYQSDKYFKSRPIKSQIAAIISPQSQEIDINTNLSDKLNNELNTKNLDLIKRPEHWGGYCVIPNKIEFWQGRDSRLHDRLIYKIINNSWKTSRLAP
tara:strand:+ start:346 stop:981 length:636 start_codon:yes stop_codon:yes gene_type:complete